MFSSVHYRCNVLYGRVSKTIQPVEKVAAGSINGPKPHTKHPTTALSASDRGSKKDMKGFFNRLVRFWYSPGLMLIRPCFCLESVPIAVPKSKHESCPTRWVSGCRIAPVQQGEGVRRRKGAFPRPGIRSPYMLWCCGKKRAEKGLRRAIIRRTWGTGHRFPPPTSRSPGSLLRHLTKFPNRLHGPGPVPHP
jgi:hypothetical protein